MKFMKVWVVVVSNDFEITGEFFPVDLEPHANAHEIKKNIKDIDFQLAAFPDPDFAVWKTVGGRHFDTGQLKHALEQNRDDVIEKIDSRTTVDNFGLVGNDMLVIQKPPSTSRISTAPEAFSDNFVDNDMLTHNERLLTSLRKSIVDKPPYVSGTLQLPNSCFSVFYKITKDGLAARFAP
jgi:hypothetical protein